MPLGRDFRLSLKYQGLSDVGQKIYLATKFFFFFLNTHGFPSNSAANILPRKKKKSILHYYIIPSWHPISRSFITRKHNLDRGEEFILRKEIFELKHRNLLFSETIHSVDSAATIELGELA